MAKVGMAKGGILKHDESQGRHGQGRRIAMKGGIAKGGILKHKSQVLHNRRR